MPRKPSISTTPGLFSSSLLSTPTADSSDSQQTSYFTLTRNPSHHRRPSIPGTIFPSPHMNAAVISTLPPPPSPAALFHTVRLTCDKRIATLDYLRRAHEGRVYWFNTLQLPRFAPTDQKKLAKRATNLFILGNSLPAAMADAPAHDYIHALIKVLSEYETHISLPAGRQAARAHSGSVSSGGAGSGGSTTGSTGTGTRLQKLFSRRRGSAAAHGGAHGEGGTSDPGSLAGEDSLYLVVPMVPFALDYFEVFATLCDMLVEVYLRVVEAVEEKGECTVPVGEAFLKFDTKVRRLVISGVVREWEEAARSGVKTEIRGIGREVLAGMV